MRRLLPPLVAAVTLLAGCGTNDRYAAINDIPPPTTEPTATEDASTGTYTLDCGRNEERHLNADNVVVAPGQPNGAHHTHEYVGNLTTDHTSTDTTLLAGGTTCAEGDLSTYYWPVLRLTDRPGTDAHSPGGGQHGNTGEVLPPAEVQIRYTGSPVSKVVAPPRFTRLVTGDASAVTSGGGTAQWSCEGIPGHTDRYPLCEGRRVVRTFDFPSCWDGRNTDSTTHKSHTTAPARNGVCPAGFFPIPHLQLRVTYTVPAGRPYAIDSFPNQSRDPRTDHAMHINLTPTPLMTKITTCLNTNHHCP
ncbi:DUF1996 domain-containing protein [Saccharothrix variisporea]|uniref:Uncharacterized protein DUF1996 n=1 Tax=Saccharothrix variisporea TaxID=543527 RepID=A0A495XL59_9PSEU|nr:DUF1996 domain-containing protein [Saccharothrix variisporea]RKT73614.1 uncharacterized protein DUF1996 [Saccharothrix variisporea]